LVAAEMGPNRSGSMTEAARASSAPHGSIVGMADPA
jgi:hypothetical protein